MIYEARQYTKWSSNKRKVFYLHFIKEFRLSEISVVLSPTPSNTRRMKHRILQELKRKKTFFQYMGNTTDCFDKPLTDFFLEHPQEEVVVVRIMSK